MSLHYDIEVKINPQVLKRGSKAKLTAILSNVEGEVEYCAAEIKGYNMMQRLKPSFNNSYAITIGIPIFTPRGYYNLIVYAADKNMKRGPLYQTKIKIV